jgi:methionine-rich copper-binding protein CopC
MSNEKRNKSFKKKDRKDDKNNEYLLNTNIESNEKYISLSLKYDKLLSDYKNLETELNNLNETSKDNYNKMEDNYKNIINDKETKIKELQTKLNNVNNINKASNPEKIFNNFISNINNSLIENKLSKEIIENIIKNIEDKLKLMIDSINNDFENRIKNIKLLYQKRNELLIKEISELKSEILNEKYNAIEIVVKDKVKNEIMEEFEEKIKELRNIIETKENIIKMEKEKKEIINNEYLELQKKYNELQNQNSQNIFALKMKEDEVDTLIMIIDATHHVKRGKYLHNLNRLSEDVKVEVENIINSLKIFKKYK